MDISNKTLAMFLVAAIVVSIAGTTISLNKLTQMSPTGMASTDLGNVTVSVGNTLSIAIQGDNTIEFGTCTPVGGSDILIDSNNDTGNLIHCTAPQGRDHIVVVNDGNVYANVSVNVSNNGETQNAGTFLPTTSGTKSWVAYKTNNVSSDCTGTMQETYANLTDITLWYPVCTNLTPGNSGVQFDVEALLASDAQTASSYMETTFWAKNV